MSRVSSLQSRAAPAYRGTRDPDTTLSVLLPTASPARHCSHPPTTLPPSPPYPPYPPTPKKGKLLVFSLQCTASGPAATMVIPTTAPTIEWVVDTGISQ